MEAVFGALKYGPLGLAAIACVYTAYVVSKVLEGPNSWFLQSRLLTRYMIFCVALLVVSIVASLADSIFIKPDARINKVRELISRLDEQEIQKYDDLRRQDPNQPAVTLGNILKPLVKRMCESVVSIATVVEAGAPHCAAEAQRPN